MVSGYPDWMKEICLKMYQQGLSTQRISKFTGLAQSAVYTWIKEGGLNRTRSEALLGKKRSIEIRKKISESLKGKLGPSWKGDNAGYSAQHDRAVIDFPTLGICQMPDCENHAIERARMDHSNLPYRKEYVLLMCKGCNRKHSFNNFVILFEEG